MSSFRLLAVPYLDYPVVHEDPGCGQKYRYDSVVVPPTPVRVPSQLSCQSSRSTKDESDNKLKSAVHRSPGIYLVTKKTPENLG